MSCYGFVFLHESKWGVKKNEAQSITEPDAAMSTVNINTFESASKNAYIGLKYPYSPRI